MLNFKSLLNVSAWMLAIFLSSAAVAANETVQLQLRWHHQFQFAGYYAALEKGYYAKAGLDVVIHEGNTESSALTEVQKNRAQYGIDNSEVLHERLNGVKLIALAAIFQHSPSILVTRKDILSINDLIGKKIMLAMNGDDDILMMIKNAGVDKTQFDTLPHSFNIQDFIKGKVDAYAAYNTDEVYTLKDKKIAFNVLEPRAYGIDFYSDILFTMESELNEHPERVKAFRQASLDGWAYAMEHPEEIIELLVTKYHCQKNKDALRFEAQAMRSLLMSDLVEIGHMNPERWKRMADVFVENKLVSHREASERLLNFTFNPNIKSDKEKQQDYFSFAIVISVLIVSMILTLLIAYESIRRENKQRRIITDALLRQRNELALYNQILKKVGSNTIDLKMLHTLLEEFILGIEIQYPNMICAICLLNQETGQLHLGAAPSLPEFYNNAVDGLEIGVGVGSCGTAAFLGERVIVENTFEHPYWINFIELAKHANVQSCWTQPIKNSQNEVLGTFAIYHREPTAPEASELVSIEQYANLVMLMVERYRDDTKIQQLAFYDPLTRLPNRRLMSERLRFGIESARREGKILALLMMDLDKFKAVNDNFGHLAGDELLEQVAARIQGRLRDVDTVARLGGDEFIILLKDIAHVDDAARVAEWIVHDLNLPFQLTQGDNVFISM